MRALIIIASQSLRDTLKRSRIPLCLIVSPSSEFTPAIKIIGRTIGKIFNRLYTVLTEGGEHSRRYAGNILEPVFNAKLLSLSIKIRLNAL